MYVVLSAYGCRLCLRLSRFVDCFLIVLVLRVCVLVDSALPLFMYVACALSSSSRWIGCLRSIVPSIVDIAHGVATVVVYYIAARG